MNKESVNFMLNALDISDDNKWQLIHPANVIFHGPMYSIEVGFEEDAYFPLGVELTKEGGMILKYRNEGGIFSYHAGNETQTNFSPTDVQMMRAIAYGPLLQQLNTE